MCTQVWDSSTQGLAYRDREGAWDVLWWAIFDALEGGVLIVDNVLKETACKWAGSLGGGRQPHKQSAGPSKQTLFSNRAS